MDKFKRTTAFFVTPSLRTNAIFATEKLAQKTYKTSNKSIKRLKSAQNAKTNPENYTVRGEN